MENEENKYLSLSKALSLGSGELAFVGDAVFELLVREELVMAFSGKVSSLHSKAVKIVCAEAQARLSISLYNLLNELEKEVYTRGRNMKHSKYPKGCSSAEYSYATALECIFGFLWITGQEQRIRAL